MTIQKILSTTLLALALCLPMAACDSGDDSDSSGDNNDDGTSAADTESETGAAVTCNVFCEAYVTQCIQGQGSTEFETNDACIAACEAWDEDGVNCRFNQIPDACDQAGNMGSTC